jgi:hypothetical protein
MQKIIPGNTYNVAVLITEQTDPTNAATSPASGLTDVAVYITNRVLTDVDDPELVALLKTAGVENGTITDTDRILKAKYLGSFSGHDTRTLAALAPGTPLWIYRRHGEEMLEPERAIVWAGN